MKDIDQAYRVLDLQPGATLRQVVEARDELRTLWDPDRLAHHPGLHAKAPGKIKEIEQAYEVLVNHLGRTDFVRSLPTGARSMTVSSSGPRSTQQPSASLFEEVFSKKGNKATIHARRHIPIWVPVISIAVLGMGIVYFISSSPQTEDEPDPASTQPSNSQSSSDLPSEMTPDQAVSREQATGSVLPNGTEPIAADPPSTVTAPAKGFPETSPAQRPTPRQSPPTATQSGLGRQVDPKKGTVPAKPRGPRPVLIRNPTEGLEPPAEKKETNDSEKKVVKPLPED